MTISVRLSACLSSTVLYCIKIFWRGLRKKPQGPQENELNTQKTMWMSRKRNIKKEMFQPTTECIDIDTDSLAIDDTAGQAVPGSGTGRTECSVADGCMPHSQYLQSMCRRWSEPMPARHVSYTDEVVDQIRVAHMWGENYQTNQRVHLGKCYWDRISRLLDSVLWPHHKSKMADSR